MKDISKLQIVYTDGSIKEITKGMICDISTDDAEAEFLNCDTETDIKPLLKALIASFRAIDPEQQD